MVNPPGGYDASIYARGWVLYALDRLNPTLAATSLGSSPYTSAKVWTNSDSSLIALVKPRLHSTSDDVPDETVIKTYGAIYQYQDGATVTVANRMYKVPLIAGETWTCPEWLYVLPGDSLLIVDTAGNGMTYSLIVTRQV